MNDLKIFSKEEARNPDPVANTQCSECGHTAGLDQFLKESRILTLDETVFEGYIRCPNCKWKRHIYFISSSTRFSQFLLQKAVTEWHTKNTNTAFKKMMVAKKSYTEAYDKDQERFSFILEKGTDENVPE